MGLEDCWLLLLVGFTGFVLWTCVFRLVYVLTNFRGLFCCDWCVELAFAFDTVACEFSGFQVFFGDLSDTLADDVSLTFLGVIQHRFRGNCTDRFY